MALLRRLAESDVRAAVLQDELDRVLLHNARLENLVDDLRVRLHFRPPRRQ